MPPANELTMWPAILRHYDAHHRPRVRREHGWFAAATTIEDAINRAALAIDERGRRCSHQRRIPQAALREARRALLQQRQAIKHARDFATLHALVTRAVHDIDSVGALYRYDTTLRISYYLDLLPAKVYLHAGTRTGARALGLPHRKPCLERHELPPELRHRPAHEVEDILCIYKDRFR